MKWSQYNAKLVGGGKQNLNTKHQYMILNLEKFIVKRGAMK